MDSSVKLDKPDLIGMAEFECRDAVSRVIRVSARNGVVESSVDCLQSSVRIDRDLEVVTEFSFEPDHDLWLRRDRIINTGNRPAEFRCPAVRFRLQGENLRVQAFTSKWCAEGQKIQLDLSNGRAEIGSKGRTSSTYEPCFIVSGDGLGDMVFHLLPYGDWRVTFEASDAGDSVDVAIDRFGDCKPFTLAPGDSFDVNLDCILLVTERDGWEKMGYRVQSYATRRLARRHAEVLPVVYNTWFDRFDRISLEGLNALLDAAAEIGCEVFVIDAGWYGGEGKGPDGQPVSWASLVGDWRENSRIFHEKTLGEFADHVRSKGLEFGIWMEPERVHESTPVVREHPDWFIASDNGCCYPDMVKPEVSNWMLSELARVVETYKARWLKIDCNLDFSADPHGAGHVPRMKEFYAVVDKLADMFPNLIIEGCASGGLRNDMATIAHFHTNVLSDKMDPIDTIRIGTSFLRKLAPGATVKWAVIYPIGNGLTRYDHDPHDTGDLVLCPTVATSWKVSSYSLDFVARVAAAGVMGISGNIAGLQPELRREFAEHIAFYKKHREFIQSSVGIPLTSVEPQSKRDGIAAIQLSSPDFASHMVFIYNIDSPEESITVTPVGLDKNALFAVNDEHGAQVLGAVSGKELLESGLSVDCRSGHARVLTMRQMR